MRARTASLLAAAAALTEQAVAFGPHHRHVHQHNKKDVVYVATEVDVVTHWTTVTVYADEVPATSSSVNSTSVASTSSFDRSEKYNPLPTSSPTTLITMTSASEAAAVEPTVAPAEPTTPVPEPTPPQDTSVPEDSPEPPSDTPKPPPPPPVETPEPPVVVPEETVVAPPPPQTTQQRSQDENEQQEERPTNPVAGLGKRGIAYNDANLVGTFFKPDSFCQQCSWAYNWDSNDNGLARDDIEFVPMLWGPIDVHTSRWQQNAEQMLSKGATHLLSFNECDNKGQCNMSPQAAAHAHVEWMNPYSSRARIGGPAVTNSNLAGEGLEWLRGFMDTCNQIGCKIDFCVVHWYSPPEWRETLYDHVTQASEICGGKPIWITEFAPLGDSNQISQFLPPAMEWLDSHGVVERYSYFMASTGNLLDTPDRLSSFGRVYAGV